MFAEVSRRNETLTKFELKQTFGSKNNSNVISTLQDSHLNV